ncbi:MAG: polysaccharide deacetylase family protein [Clostridiales bacterium]|nr:polysaccharide deacetylase family protein [Clostridiales bacterium]
MNKKMTHRLITALMALVLFILTTAAAIIPGAADNAYNWYCIRTPGNKRPPCPAEMSFVDKLGGFYIDKNKTDSDTDKVVYLTFDAGYENGNVEKILDTLKDKEVTGAFFVLGNLVTSNTDLVKRMADEGHLVCNHTYHHRDMSKYTDKAEFALELTSLEDAYRKLTGREMSKYYRPPEGRFTEQNLKFAQEMGYSTVFWSFAYADWDNNKQPSAEYALKKILSNVHNGAVILLHPTSSTNAEIMPQLIDSLKSSGYRFGTLDELCGTEPQGGLVE